MFGMATHAFRQDLSQYLPVFVYDQIKRTWDHYNWYVLPPQTTRCAHSFLVSSSCPAWRNQARTPVNSRTCKHIRQLLGDAYENARIKVAGQ